MAELNWSDDQWQKASDAVTEAFGKASVAAAFLPMYGPLEGSAEIVRNERLRTDFSSGRPVVRLDRDHDSVNQKLVNVTANVELSSEQVKDETLSNALLAFRRAGSILAQEKDRIVFNGLRRQPRSFDSEYVANNINEPQEGLADLPNRRLFDRFAAPVPASIGEAVITSIVGATQALESRFNPGPFACVLGSELFTRVHEPSPALVLPADRIAPLLKGGMLLRATTMDAEAGIVVAYAGNAVDIVVGTPPTVQFLQRTQDAKYLFRVYARFSLRIRDADNSPVAGFRINTTIQRDDIERIQQELAEAERRSS